jgi:hypothetical protein
VKGRGDPGNICGLNPKGKEDVRAKPRFYVLGFYVYFMA